MNRSDSLYIGIVFVLFILSVTGFALLRPVGEQEVGPRLQSAPSYQYGVTGERYTVNPDRFEILCPGECIPELRPENTRYESVDAADAWLDPGDMVVSVTVDDQRVAFPVSVLQHHFIVNTWLNNRPVLVTYAPYAGYGTAFLRQVHAGNGARNLSFTFAGSLLHGDIVMQDDTGTSLWNPYRGEAITGEMASTPLHRIDTDIVRWSLWRQNNPNGSVLSRQTDVFDASRYEDDPYFAYPSSPDAPFHPEDTNPVHPKDIVYGVSQGSDTAAYREVHLKDVELIQDMVGDVPILLVQNEQTGEINGFKREVNGETLDFSINNQLTRLHSGNTVWTLDGEAISGSLDGQQLEEIPLTRMYWFAWKGFHPSTRFYEP